MNKIYKTVWNASLACVQVVSELAIGHQSSGGVAGTVQLGLQRFAFFNLALLPIMVWAAVNPDALPQGGNITQGSGQIQQQGNVLNIQQNSQNLHTQWNSFNIGKDATVNFKQPNRSSVAVNQVLDNNASQIMGRLNANGQVFLLNPNGVIFSKTAQVNVGGLVASTLKLSEQDALTGRFKLQGDAASNARVENHGSIIANGGTVALIAPNVVNTGSIKTANGITHLTSANQVTLALQDGSLTQFQVDQGVVQGLVDNQGAIVADNGAVYLTAKGKDALSRAVVNHSGIIEANRLSHNAKGEVILLADMQTGQTNVSGRISAQGMNEQDGGFIETSAAVINIADSADITTLSAQGKTGEWLIDPYNIVISTATNSSTSNPISGGEEFSANGNDSVVNVNTLQTALGSNNVTITTDGAGSQEGNITVDAPIAWSSNSDLTLKAHNNIHINKNITATGADAGLNLEYGLAHPNAGNKADYYLANGVKVNLQAGQNFSTKRGSDGTTIPYTVITALGGKQSITGTDFQGINGNLSGHYALGADIDGLGSKDFIPIAGYTPTGFHYGNFTGQLHGLGHDLNNFTYSSIGMNEAGIFANLRNGELRDFNVNNAFISARNYMGLVVGQNNGGTIHNVNAQGTILGLGRNGTLGIGGIAGLSTNGTIKNVTTDLVIETPPSLGNVVTSSLGGIVGKNTSGSIENAQAKVSMDFPTSDFPDVMAGGLVGENVNGSIINSHASGQILINANLNSPYYYTNQSVLILGGAVGKNSGQINLSSSSVDVSSASPKDKLMHLGGLVGKNEGGTVKNSDATGSVQGRNEVGGLIGYNFNGHVIDSHASGTVTGQNRVGGLIGLNEVNKNNAGLLSNVYATGTVTATGNQVGGLVGFNNVASNLSNSNSGSISNASASGQVTGTGKVGGLVGENVNAHISHATTTAGQEVRGHSIVGGLVGNNYSSSSVSPSVIDDAEANSDVWGVNNAAVVDAIFGGLVGLNSEFSTIQNSTATGAVRTSTGTKQSTIGGLVGRNEGLVTSSTATGNVTGSGDSPISMVGGLVGHNASIGRISDVNIGNKVELVYNKAGGTGYVGGLVGVNDGSIINASATGTFAPNSGVISGNSVWFGGLVGQNSSAIADSHSSMTIKLSLSGKAGGLVGENLATGKIVGSNASGNMTVGGNTIAGGLVASNEGSIKDAYASGTVTSGTAGQSGGLVSVNSGNIQNAYATGTVSTGFMGVAGGLVGNNAGTIAGSYATGVVKANTGAPIFGTISGTAGGLVGINSGSISDSFAKTGTVYGSTAGGLVGNNLSTGVLANTSAQGKVEISGNILNDGGFGGLVGINAGEIHKSSAQGDVSRAVTVTGTGHVGGLVGKNLSDGVISQSHAQGSVTETSVAAALGYAGGLVGLNEGGTIVDVYATGNVSSKQNGVGGLIGVNQNSSLSNVYATGSVNGVDDVGGLIGRNESSKLSDVYATGSVAGANNVGGLVGLNQNSNITNANTAATSIVTASGDNVGGLIGNNYSTSSNTYSITNSHALGDVKVNSTSSTSVGGLIGRNQNSNLSDVSASGDVTANTTGGSAYAGGLVGQNSGTISNSSATGDVSANANGVFAHAGGLIGLNSNGEITDSSATGDVTANNPILTAHGGGLVGLNYSGAITNSSATGNVSVNSAVADAYVFAGGLVGWNNGTISNSLATGNISANATGGTAYAGGLVGSNQSGAISNSSAEGNVNANAVSTYAGGLVGYNWGDSINIAYATGTVNGNDNVGGLVGSNVNGHISNAYASGAVTGTNQVGGLVGSHTGTGSIAQTYATGKVIGTGTDVGGLVGNADSTTTVSTSFWDTQSTGLNTSAGGAGAKGVSTAQIQDLNTFKIAGWDIDDEGGTGKVWRIYSGQTAPLLRSFLTQKTITAPADKTVTYDATQHSIAPLTGLDAHTLMAGSSTGTNAGIYTTSYYSGQQGYDFVGDRESTLTINKAKLTVTANNDRKTYDATAYVGGNGVSYSGFAGNEDDSVLGGALNYKGNSQGAKDAGSYVIGIDGLTSNNYDIAYGTGSLTVDKAKLTITANDYRKTYDATAYAGGNGVSYAGFAGNEDDSVLGGALAYKGNSQGAKNAGSYVIDVDGLTSNNYDIAYGAGSLTVGKANVTLQAATDSRTYNGTNASNVQVIVNGLQGQDNLSNLSQSFDSHNAGNRTLSVDAGYVVNDGNNGGNYDVTVLTPVKGSITKATLDLQAASDSRTYNGTVASNGTVGVSGLFGTDQVTGLSQSFDSRNAGARDVLVNGGYVVDDGNGGLNYDVVTHTASGSIAKAKLDAVTGVGALDRAYNGLLGVDLDYSQARIVGTLFGADQVSVAHTGTGTMANKRAGVNKQVNIQGLGLSGADAGNYELSDSTAQTQVDISKASIGSVSGLKGIDRQVDGSNSVAIDVSGAQLSQVVADDQVFVSGAQGSVANNQVGTHLVSITDIDLGGADADNYEWDFAPTTTTVNIVAVPTVPPTVSPTVPPTVAPSSAPQVAFSSANPYQRAIDFDEDRLRNPLNGNPVQIEIIGNGVNTDGIQTLSGELR